MVKEHSSSVEVLCHANRTRNILDADQARISLVRARIDRRGLEVFLYHGHVNIRVRRNHCFPLHSLAYVDGSFKLAKNMYVISRSMVHYSEGFGKSFVDSEPQ